jgi:hypothetical protein
MVESKLSIFIILHPIATLFYYSDLSPSKNDESYKVSDILLADDVHIDLPRIIVEKTLQFLLYLLHLLLVAQTVEDVQRSLQVHPRIPDLQTDIDSPQQFQRSGQLEGLPEDLFLQFRNLQQLSNCLFVALAFQQRCGYFSSRFYHSFVLGRVKLLVEGFHFLYAGERAFRIVNTLEIGAEGGVQFCHFFGLGIVFLN